MLLKNQPILDERLAAFDPKTHSGEVMADKPIGLEKLDDKENSAQFDRL